jgi:hypothetical protein
MISDASFSTLLMHTPIRRASAPEIMQTERVAGIPGFSRCDVASVGDRFAELK